MNRPSIGVGKLSKTTCNKARMRAFDRLPRALRDFLNEAYIQYCPAAMRRTWDQHRKLGWTLEQFLEQARLVDRRNADLEQERMLEVLRA